MKHRVVIPFSDGDEIFNIGEVIDIQHDLAAYLGEHVTPILEAGSAWLINGELRTRGHVQDLAAEICCLTKGDLTLQRKLLKRHCEAYDRNHFWMKVQEWEEKTAIMQYDGGLSKDDAEIEAARILHLLAFLGDLQSKEVQAA